MTPRFALLAVLSAALIVGCSSLNSAPTTTVAGSTKPAAPGGSVDTTLYVENRGGDAFAVQIGGTAVATVDCGESVALTPGQDNVPALPWDMTVVRVSDKATIVSSRVVRLPQWLVQRPGFQPTLDYSEAEGTFGPCTR